jgi:hypothetical protein
MRLTNKPILALACALAAVSTVAGCSKATNNAPAGPPPALTPQQQAQAGAMAQGRQADAQKAAAAMAARQSTTPQSGSPP